MAAMTGSTCIFCAIAAGTAPGHRIAEDDRVLAFLDLFPAARGHTLIVPRAHAENLFEVGEEDLAAVAVTSRRIARAIRRALAPDGLGVFQLNGAAAGQTVFHYHMHLIPRWAGTPLALHGRRRAEDSELAPVAEEIRKALAGPASG